MKVKYLDYAKFLYQFSTFVCPTEIIAFSERAEDFKKLGVQVMACSTDSVFRYIFVNLESVNVLFSINIPVPDFE